jgi:hypothetical protein
MLMVPALSLARTFFLFTFTSLDNSPGQIHFQQKK